MYNTPKISIIITMYNVQNYIETAIKSVFNQNYENIELIAVDYGSSDQTVEKSRALLKNFNNHKLITQQNRGPGGARNTGLRTATGEYLLFLDGDDWLANESLNCFALACKVKPDAVFSNRILFYEHKEKYIDDKVFKHNSTGAVKPGRQLLERFAITGKIFNREFLIRNNILFPEKIIWEDYPFSYSVLAKANRIDIITATTYVYRKRNSWNNQSITQRNRLDLFCLQSRFQQINLDRLIIDKSNLRKVFPQFNFDRREFQKRLFIDIKYLATETNEEIREPAFNLFRNFLIDNKEDVFNCISQNHRKLYQNIIDGNINETLYFIKYILSDSVKHKSINKKTKILTGHNWKKAMEKVKIIECHHLYFNSIKNVIDYCNKNKITILLANNYSTQDFLEKNSHALRKKGLKFLVNSRFVIDNFSNKELFNKFMILNGFGDFIPRTYTIISNINYPCIAKPKLGGAGREVRILHSNKELYDITDSYFISEYIQGHEYVTTIFFQDNKIINQFSYIKKADDKYYILQKIHKNKLIINQWNSPFLDLFVEILKYANPNGEYCQCSFNYKIVNNYPKIFEVNCRMGYTLAMFPNDFSIFIDSYIKHAHSSQTN